MDLIGLLLVAGVIWLVVRLTRGRLGWSLTRRSQRFKCHNCKHRRRLFDDGVLCGYGDREVFKNARHIAMCPDWTPSDS